MFIEKDSSRTIQREKKLTPLLFIPLLVFIGLVFVISSIIQQEVGSEKSHAAEAGAVISPTIDPFPPTVLIINPLNKSIIPSAETNLIKAIASDNIEVQKVEFYVNNTLLCTDSTAPYECSWPVSEQKMHYTIVAKSYDNNSNSAVNTVTVNTN